MDTKLNGKSDTHSHPYLNTANVANNLTTTSGGYALDARQGKALNNAVGGKASIGAEVRFGSVHIGSGDAYIYPGDNSNLLFRYNPSNDPKYTSIAELYSHKPKVLTVYVSSVPNSQISPVMWIFAWYGIQNMTKIGEEVENLKSAGHTILGGCIAGGGLNDSHESENTPCWDSFICGVTYYNNNVPYNWGYIYVANMKH